VQKLQREAAMRAGKSKIFRKLFAIEDESEELMDGMRFNMHVLDCVLFICPSSSWILKHHCS